MIVYPCPGCPDCEAKLAHTSNVLTDVDFMRRITELRMRVEELEALLQAGAEVCSQCGHDRNTDLRVCLHRNCLCVSDHSRRA